MYVWFRSRRTTRILTDAPYALGIHANEIDWLWEEGDYVRVSGYRLDVDRTSWPPVQTEAKVEVSQPIPEFQDGMRRMQRLFEVSLNDAEEIWAETLLREHGREYQSWSRVLY